MSALDAALALARDPGRVPVIGEVSEMANSRILLTTLSMRTSARGRAYLSGWLGKASVVTFEGQPDKHGNPTWDVFLAEPEPRNDRPKASTSPPGRDPPSEGQTPRSPGALARVLRPLGGPRDDPVPSA